MTRALQTPPYFSSKPRTGKSWRVLLPVSLLLLCSGFRGLPAAEQRTPVIPYVWGEGIPEKPVRTFYINPQTGQDTNPGTSPAAGWQSLRPLMLAALRPGDRVVLAAGQTFTGPLTLSARGDKQSRILLESSGPEPALIDAGGGHGIELRDSAYVTIRNLKVTGSGRTAGNNGNGIRLVRTQGVELDSIEVSGFRLSGIETAGDADSRLTRLRAHHNGFAGISTTSDYEGMPPTSGLYIAHCQAWDNAGDPQNSTNHSGNGIVIGGVRGGMIESCAAWNNGYDMPRTGNGPVGIWAWQCDRITIQHCISHDNKTSKGGLDGGGFDFDGGVTNSVLQYNLSYGNQGAGYLLCQYPGAKPWKDNVCRFNISWQDGSVNGHAGIAFWAGDKGISGAQIYNNTIAGAMFAVASAEKIPGLVFLNNIFCAEKEVIHGPFAESRFAGNWYWSRDDKPVFWFLDEKGEPRAPAPELMKDAGGYGKPDFAIPARLDELPVAPQKLREILFFRPPAGSPLQQGGVRPPEHVPDFTGRKQTSAMPPFLGVFMP